MLHPQVKEFKEFMKGRTDLEQRIRTRKSTLQELFEEWCLSGDVALEERGEKTNEVKADSHQGEWTGQLMKLLSSFDGKKWNEIFSDMQGLLEMAQIYLAEFAEKQDEKRK